MNIVRYLGMRGRTICGKTIVHVGAHFGQEARKYQMWGAKRVIWIEAEPSNFAKLEQNIEQIRKLSPSPFVKITGVPQTEHILIQALVGDADGKAVIFHLFNNEGASNSVYSLHDYGREQFKDLKETGEILTLPMRLLDNVLEEAGVAPEIVDILVLDIQGAELLCLKGATRLLTSIRYLESEISSTPVYEGGVLLNELEDWLGERGFIRKTLIRRSHMNAIYVRA
ncbi:MAG: FkbM family methyltransferase [Hyphomicrobiales bacterium]|nr:FkbM family methyltransferase [Hyphomicrobiales bacterium]MCP4999644.1 FkbM family methyltransferase [Hyphomicrobiales bacterium]